MKAEDLKDLDLLIVGSGAGAMVASLFAKANRLKVLVIEKDKYYGGSTAMSGGGIWVPNNPTLQRAGVKDTSEQIITYMKEVTKGSVPEEKLKVYANEGPKMLQFLEEFSPHLTFFWSKGYSDYHPEYTHGHAEGRSIEATPFNLKKLEEDAKYIKPTPIEFPGGLYMTASEFKEMTMVMRTWKGKKTAAKVGFRTFYNRLTGKNIVALGQSLIGRLRLAMKEHQIPLWLKTSFQDFIVEENRVVGAKVLKEGDAISIKSKFGVLLACGGFDHNNEMREKYLPKLASDNYSAGSKENTGEGILAALKLNADTEYMDDAWWMPSFTLPNGVNFTLVSERAIPRSIIVGENGKRFTNEAAPYVNFVHDQIDAKQKTAWQIIDSVALKRYMYAGKAPGVAIPKEWFENGTTIKAESIEELAKKINVPYHVLSNELKVFNEMVSNGKDTLFGRGESAYDKYYGDPTLANPVMDYLNKPPYYAFKLVMGDIGTKGGIKTDEWARAIRKDGSIIKGLYATGNVSGSVMGRDYAGAGATIGPSMVFGYATIKYITDNL